MITNYQIFLSHEGVMKGNTFPEPLTVIEKLSFSRVDFMLYQTRVQHAIDSALDISDPDEASWILGLQHGVGSFDNPIEKMKPYKIEGYEMEEIKDYLDYPSYPEGEEVVKQYRLKPVSK